MGDSMPRSCLLFYTLLLFFSLAVLKASSSTQVGGGQHFGSQCFHVRGVPTLKLQCPGDDLIRIMQSFYGVPGPSSPSNQTCSYSAADNHCIQLSDMSQNCNGRTRCTVHVSNPFLVTCLAYAAYMQVNYTCVPRYKSVDVCEEVIVSGRHGFLRSPHYPDSPYSKSRHCRCFLHTSDRYVVINLLDMAINGSSGPGGGACSADYLSISGHGRRCGLLGAESTPQRLDYGGHKLTLEFKTDDSHEGRGFWLDYAGSHGGKVTVSCNTVPSVQPGRGKSHTESDPGLANYTGPAHNSTHIRAHVNHTGDLPLDRILTEAAGMLTYNVDDVQIATGVVVGILILIAIVIIIFLVFKR